MCCANCAIYPVKALREERHALSGFWFNPNIQPYQEYKLRLDSLKRLADKWHINMIYVDEYDKDTIPDIKLQNEIPQRPERCKSCYRRRLEKTAGQAQKQGFDAFTTTLLISPYQDFEQIITTGKELADKYNVFFYSKDFRQYFREAMDYAKELGLYRQKYCGCLYSKKEKSSKLKSQNCGKSFEL